VSFGEFIGCRDLYAVRSRPGSSGSGDEGVPTANERANGGCKMNFSGAW
jgi:hypothetical protein